MARDEALHPRVMYPLASDFGQSMAHELERQIRAVMTIQLGGEAW